MKLAHAMIKMALVTAFASLVSTAHGEDGPLPNLKVTIYPAAAPRPSLKYQLLPKFNQRLDANAAVYYGKVTAESTAVFGNRELLDRFDDWREGPLAALRGDDVKMNISGIEEKLRRAALCDWCDWQLPVREPNFYRILLPEVQQTRQFAKLLATDARIHIARGQFDEAIVLLQSGFALERHVAEGETIVNGLVAIAINSMLCAQLTEYVQQPGAPNLYWALTMLPSPIVEFRKAVEAELYAFSTSFPELRDLEARRTPDEWRRLLYDFWREALSLANEANPQQATDAQVEAAVSQNLKEFPRVKENLVRRGLPADEVEAMSAAQVVLTNDLQAFYEIRDDVFQWFFVPYPAAKSGIATSREAFEAADDEADAAQRLAKIFLPWTSGVRVAEIRSQRDIAILRVIEALRLHAALHDGQLPASLAELTAVPVPRDPRTDKPFGYRLEGKTAYIEADPTPGRPSVYEVTVAKE